MSDAPYPVYELQKLGEDVLRQRRVTNSQVDRSKHRAIQTLLHQHCDSVL